MSMQAASVAASADDFTGMVTVFGSQTNVSAMRSDAVSQIQTR